MTMLCVLLVLILSVGIIHVASTQNAGSDITQLKQSLSTLQSQLHTQEQIHAAVLSNVLSSVTSLKDELASVKEKLNVSLCGKGSEITQLKQSLSTLQSQSQAQEQKYAAVLSNVLSSITSLKDEHHSTVLDLASVKETLNVSHNDLDVVKAQLNMSILTNTQLNKSNDNVCSRLSEAEKNITALQSELSAIRTNTERHFEVGFEVLLAKSYAIHTKDTLKFGNVKLNIGGNYNARSGVFTAPVSGTYLFWAHIVYMYNGADKTACAINISSTVRGLLARGYVRLTHAFGIGAATPTVIAKLNKGEQVSFRVELCATGVAILGSESSYGGTLLHMA